MARDAVPAVDLHAGFAVALLRALPTAPGENLVVSPWSVSSALGVLAPGILDDSMRREIARLLVASAATEDPLTELASAAARVTRPLASDDESILAVTNTLWVDAGRTPVLDFVEQLRRWPGAALRSAPLRSAPDDARQLVNADVAETTRGLIPEILPPGAIGAEACAVIVNALYLLASWIEPFAESRTESEPFHAPSGPTEVPTMRGHREVAYARDEQAWEYLALPLGLGFEAEVLLPPPSEPPLVGPEHLDAARLAGLRQRADHHRVDLHLPRLWVELGTDLGPPLRQLGLGRLFAPPPSIRGVVVEEPLLISTAIHAAVLRVDEHGVEGAAATALVLRAAALHRAPEVEVRVDRPFFLLVTHRTTRAILFLAQVNSPDR